MNKPDRQIGSGAARVLLVDDDRQLCEMLTEYLSTDGYAVAAVHDGQAGVDALREADSGTYDAVVLDITMPVLDGFEALRRLRTFSSIPVLMLTARGDELDRIVGLEIGADDYLPKPFNPRELSARLRAILRRSRASVEQQVAGAAELLRAGDLVLDGASLSVRLNELAIDVTATEFAVLDALVRARGRVVGKDDLSRQALGRRWMPDDRSIDTHIANLRRKLGPGGDGEPRIKTVRGQGYLFIAHEQSQRATP